MSKLLRRQRIKPALYVLPLVALTSLFLVASPQASTRTWKSSDGVYSLDAEYVGVKGGKLSLRKPNGDVIEVPLARLSAEDQAYVAKQAVPTEEASTPAAATSPPPQKQTLSQLLNLSGRLRTASEVVKAYKLFLQNEQIVKSDRKAAEEQLPVWEERAKKGMVRVGSRWLEPAEANDLKRQARQLIEEAMRLLEVGQDEAAINKCVKASKLDPDAILADFLLGLGYALVACDAKDANRHFAECVRRDPQHVSALNNLALSEVRLRQYPQALAHWRAALKVAPAAPEIIQNLGRLLHLAKQRRILLPTEVQRQFSDLYAEAAISADAKEFNSRVGWLYLGHYAPLGEQSVIGKDVKNKLIKIGSGTGFVVHPEYILTNRHVVEDCAGLLVVPPGGGNHELQASVVGVADGEDNDLAVIYCKGLAAPPLPFIRADLAPRGTEVMVLGFPGMKEGKMPSLKATRGTIAGLPDASYGCYTLDAIISYGNSGGPVCDSTASVLGIAHRFLSPDVGEDRHQVLYSGAVPHSQALPLLKRLIPGFEQLPPNANKKEWSDVDGMVSRSTVLIWCQSVESVGGISGKREAPKGARPLEDRWCMTCNRTGFSKCATCQGTGVAVAPPLTIIKSIGPTGTEHRNAYPEKVTCWSCRGTAKAQCPDCINGIEVGLQ
jgi:S1-C subfamily serine protease